MSAGNAARSFMHLVREHGTSGVVVMPESVPASRVSLVEAMVPRNRTHFDTCARAGCAAGRGCPLLLPSSVVLLCRHCLPAVLFWRLALPTLRADGPAPGVGVLPPAVTFAAGSTVNSWLRRDAQRGLAQRRAGVHS